MSWAEDMGYDVEYGDPVEEIQLRWNEGFHTTRDGIEIRIEDMEDSHIRNTIKFFKDCYPDIDTHVLEEELLSREANQTP